MTDVSTEQAGSIAQPSIDESSTSSAPRSIPTETETTALPTSTPIKNKINSSSHLPHTRSHIDEHLAEEFVGNRARVDLDIFLNAFGLNDLYATQGWMGFVAKINTDAEIKDQINATTRAKVERDLYHPFAAIANRMTELFVGSCGSRVRRHLRFLGLGQKRMAGASSYNCGFPVTGTSSTLQPDGLAVLLDGDVLPSDDTAARVSTTRSSSSKVKLDESRKKAWEEKDRRLEEDVEWKDCVLSVEHKFSRTPAASLPPNPPSFVQSEPIAGRKLERLKASQPESTSSRKRGRRNLPEKSKPHKRPKFLTSTVTDPITSNMEPKDMIKGELQLASYAMEVVSALGNRTHTFGILLDLFETSLWLFDRSGAISSERFDFRTNLEGLAKFIVAMSVISDKELGFNDAIRPPSGVEVGSKAALAPKDLSGFVVTGQKGSFTLKKLLDRRIGFVGRGTLVYTAETSSRPDVAVKLSWQVCTRPKEWETIEIAIDTCGAEVREFIVDVVEGWTVPGSQVSAGFRRRLGNIKNPVAYEDRELRIVITELLDPVTTLTMPEDMKYAGWCVMKAIAYLDKAEIQHRDISPGNVGFKRLQCGRLLVKLIDFDHARKKDEPQSSMHRTGTLPFMAIDLLRNHTTAYLTGFDIESLLWTLLWIVICYVDGKDAYGGKNHPLESWFSRQVTLDQIAVLKFGFLAEPTQVTNEHFSDMRDDMERFIQHFSDGYADQAKERRKTRNYSHMADALYGLEITKQVESLLEGMRWPARGDRCNCLAPEKRLCKNLANL